MFFLMCGKTWQLARDYIKDGQGATDATGREYKMQHTATDGCCDLWSTERHFCEEGCSALVL